MSLSLIRNIFFYGGWGDGGPKAHRVKHRLLSRFMGSRFNGLPTERLSSLSHLLASSSPHPPSPDKLTKLPFFDLTEGRDRSSVHQRQAATNTNQGAAIHCLPWLRVPGQRLILKITYLTPSQPGSSYCGWGREAETDLYI